MDYERDKKSSRRATLKTLTGLGTASLLAGCADSLALRSDDDRPRNVVFVLSDDHRYDFMDFLDEPGTPAFLETPNLSRMARKGAHLSNVFVNTSLCAPSRATVLTGQYTHKHEALNNTKPIPTVNNTFPEQLQKQGYETAFIGKWHLFQNDSAHPQPGFDHWVSFKGQGRYFRQNFNINGQRVRRDGYITDILTEYALDYLRNRDGDRPFFLFLSHKAVHAQWHPAPRHKGRYADVTIDPPETIDETKNRNHTKPKWVENQRTEHFGVANRNFKKIYRKYCEALLALDESVGALMDHLKDSGLVDSTLLMYTSDNGFLLGEHGLLDKRVAYEPSIRIPLLAYAPNFIEPETEVTQLISNIDFAPTLLDLAGQSVPDAMDGRSFLPLLTGGGVDQWRNALLYEYFWSPRFPYPPGQFALRTKSAKYILSYGRPHKNEFYDLKSDPLEQHNRINDKAYQQRISRLKKRLFDRLNATNAPFNPVQP